MSNQRLTSPWAVEDIGGGIYALTPDGRKNVGVLVTHELAEEAVNSHNAALAERKARESAGRRGVTRMTGLTGVQIGDGGSQTNIF